jgi:hypothetical protein
MIDEGPDAFPNPESFTPPTREGFCELHDLVKPLERAPANSRRFIDAVPTPVLRVWSVDGDPPLVFREAVVDQGDRPAHWPRPQYDPARVGLG